MACLVVASLMRLWGSHLSALALHRWKLMLYDPTLGQCEERQDLDIGATVFILQRLLSHVTRWLVASRLGRRAGCTSCRALDPSCRVLLCALCTKSFILPTPYTLRATRRVSSRYEPHRRRAYLKYSMGDEARRVVEEGDGCRRGPWRITVRSTMGNYVCSCIVRGCLDLPPWRSELPRAPTPADIPCRD